MSDQEADEAEHCTYDANDEKSNPLRAVLYVEEHAGEGPG